MVTSVLARTAYGPRRSPKEKTPSASILPHHVLVAGTHVSTVRGEVRAETLRPGDMLKTQAGRIVPLVGVTLRTCTAAQLMCEPEFQPVVLRRGAIGPGQPRRDTTLCAAQPVQGRGGAAARMTTAASVSGGTAALRPAASRVTFVLLTLDPAATLVADGIPVGPLPAARLLNPADTPC